MSDTPNDVKAGEGTLEAGQPQSNPSTAGEGNPSEAGAGVNAPSGEEQSNKRSVDPERLNQLLQESKKVKDLERELEQLRRSQVERDERLASAISGETKSSDKFSEFAKKWNTDAEFLREFNEMVSSSALSQVDERIQPLRREAAQVMFDRQMSDLANEFDSARNMSSQEKEEFRQMAVKPEYRTVPLKDLYKIYSFGQSGSSTAPPESSRPGAAQKSSGQRSLADMTLEEKEQYLDELAQQSR